MCHSFDQRIWLTVIFFRLEESHMLFQIWISFAKLSSIFSQFLLSWAELQKYTPSVLKANCYQAIQVGLLILFLYATLHKVWLFEKFLFEVEELYFGEAAKVS